MPFSKSFPEDSKGYSEWREVYLTEEEEKEAEKKCREENIELMKECIEDAEEIFSEKDLKDYQSDVIDTATSLFQKRASHEVFWKEQRAKEKFDNKYKGRGKKKS